MKSNVQRARAVYKRHHAEIARRTSVSTESGVFSFRPKTAVEMLTEVLDAGLSGRAVVEALINRLNRGVKEPTGDLGNYGVLVAGVLQQYLAEAPTIFGPTRVPAVACFLLEGPETGLDGQLLSRARDLAPGHEHFAALIEGEGTRDERVYLIRAEAGLEIWRSLLGDPQATHPAPFPWEIPCYQIAPALDECRYFRVHRRQADFANN